MGDDVDLSGSGDGIAEDVMREDGLGGVFTRVLRERGPDPALASVD